MTFLPTILLAAALATLPAPMTGTVIDVTDGDTIRVNVNGIHEKIRLIGIDTPETKDPRKPVEYFGLEAAQYTDRHLRGQTVRLELDQANAHIGHRDRYGRLLAYVYVGGELFNLQIIRDGYAHAYTKYPFSMMEAFREAQSSAREASQGLWRLLRSHRVRWYTSRRQERSITVTGAGTWTSRRWRRISRGCKTLDTSPVRYASREVILWNTGTKDASGYSTRKRVNFLRRISVKRITGLSMCRLLEEPFHSMSVRISLSQKSSGTITTKSRFL
jgi:micrococcal nuclease